MIETIIPSPHACARLPPPPPLDLERHALFLDLDGTVLEIAERPDLVKADETLRARLRELHRSLGGALAIVSGRTIADIDRILGDAPMSVSGVHGQVCRIRGESSDAIKSGPLCANCPAHEGGYCDRRCAQQQNEVPGQALSAAARAFERLNTGDLLKVLVEHKGGAFAIHYRAAPEHGHLVRRAATELAERHGLHVIHGSMVVELLAVRASKADAVDTFMRLHSFENRVPIAVGDDTTDEDAFAAARAHGGFGVRVGEADHTNAIHQLAHVAAVRAWLGAGPFAGLA